METKNRQQNKKYLLFNKIIGKYGIYDTIIIAPKNANKCRKKMLCVILLNVCLMYIYLNFLDLLLANSIVSLFLLFNVAPLKDWN